MFEWNPWGLAMSTLVKLTVQLGVAFAVAFFASYLVVWPVVGDVADYAVAAGSAAIILTIWGLIEWLFQALGGGWTNRDIIAAKAYAQTAHDHAERLSGNFDIVRDHFNALAEHHFKLTQVRYTLTGDKWKVDPEIPK